MSARGDRAAASKRTACNQSRSNARSSSAVIAVDSEAEILNFETSLPFKQYVVCVRTGVERFEVDGGRRASLLLNGEQLTGYRNRSRSCWTVVAESGKHYSPITGSGLTTKDLDPRIGSLSVPTAAARRRNVDRASREVRIYRNTIRRNYEAASGLSNPEGDPVDGQRSDPFLTCRVSSN